MAHAEGMMAPGHPLLGAPCTQLLECPVCGAVHECGRPSVFKAFNMGNVPGFIYCEPHIDPDGTPQELCPDGVGCGA